MENNNKFSRLKKYPHTLGHCFKVGETWVLTQKSSLRYFETFNITSLNSCNDYCLGRALGTVVKLLLKINTSHIVVPGFKSQLRPDSGSLLMHTLGDRGDDTSTWVLATDVGDSDWVQSSCFSLAQLWLQWAVVSRWKISVFSSAFWVY